MQIRVPMKAVMCNMGTLLLVFILAKQIYLRPRHEPKFIRNVFENVQQKLTLFAICVKEMLANRFFESLWCFFSAEHMIQRQYKDTSDNVVSFLVLKIIFIMVLKG